MKLRNCNFRHLQDLLITLLFCSGFSAKYMKCDFVDLNKPVPAGFMNMSVVLKCVEIIIRISNLFVIQSLYLI